MSNLFHNVLITNDIIDEDVLITNEIINDAKRERNKFMVFKVNYEKSIIHALRVSIIN